MREAFLAGHGWSGAAATALAGDASGRRYTRLVRSGDRAVLMDSPGTPVGPFLRVAAHLAACGFSAPRIHAADPKAGLVLMEDLGDALFSREIARDPEAELPLYEAATDLLADLHRHEVPAWAAEYGPEAMAAALAPFWEHYLPGTDAALIDRIERRFRALLAQLSPETGVLLHRDYHAQNLIWLPERAGTARVGLLDFQDALAGHRSYDLGSLLQDARRDIGPDLEERMIRRYIAATECDADRFRAAYAVQAAQRHLRILGIFARLDAAQGKPGYLALIPRVRGYLDRCLAHPALASLAEPLGELLPEPEAAGG